MLTLFLQGNTCKFEIITQKVYVGKIVFFHQVVFPLKYFKEFWILNYINISISWLQILCWYLNKKFHFILYLVMVNLQDKVDIESCNFQESIENQTCQYETKRKAQKNVLKEFFSSFFLHRFVIDIFLLAIL